MHITDGGLSFAGNCPWKLSLNLSRSLTSSNQWLISIMPPSFLPLPIKPIMNRGCAVLQTTWLFALHFSSAWALCHKAKPMHATASCCRISEVTKFFPYEVKQKHQHLKKWVQRPSLSICSLLGTPAWLLDWKFQQ